MVYCSGEDPSEPPRIDAWIALVKVTYLTLAVAALAAVVYLVQRIREKRADRLERESLAKKKREARAASDRRDIHALTTNLRASAPDAPPSTIGGMSDDESAPRRRVSSAAPHGFDPDLPAR